MQIIDALKTLHQKVTSKAATSDSIAGVIEELAQNWPESSDPVQSTGEEKAG